MSGCERPHFADDYCGPHYKRKWRHGDPLAGGSFKRRGIVERLAGLWFLEPETGCWLWMGGTDSMGYGSIVIAKRTYRAHRVSYEAHVGPIPDGMDIDHLCRTKRCVNFAHLEPVTHSENLRRHYARTVTACPHGHTYDQANTYIGPDGKRRCRACLNERQRRRRQHPGQ